MANKTKRSKKAETKTFILDLMLRAGIFRAAQMRHKHALTVLNYHRIDDALRAGFDTFAPNVTAAPDEFARQMDYVQRHFSSVTCSQVACWLRGEAKLPPYPVLITFDDGYRDNYLHAYPVLRARNISAVIFLTTSLIGRDEPVYWDHVAYCFHHTRKTSVTLPYMGSVSWMDDRGRDKIMKTWIESLKLLQDSEKQSAFHNLAGLLDVTVPAHGFRGLYLTWDEVREMSQNGIEMGSHTVGHPILTRIPLTQVEQELVSSKQRIESEINKHVTAFAYPNGGIADYSADVIKLVQRSGYELAFTLTGGVARYPQIRSNPFTISRIYLDRSDTFPRFVARIS